MFYHNTFPMLYVELIMPLISKKKEKEIKIPLLMKDLGLFKITLLSMFIVKCFLVTVIK